MNISQQSRLFGFVLPVLVLCGTSSTNALMMLTSHYASKSAEICAHRTLPFGTRLNVTNPRNGKSMVLVVHDRGPFIRGRSLDISNQAARALGFGALGLVSLDVQTLH